jgi:hypothetical protein
LTIAGEMSKTETPMIRKYWESVMGTLVEEFPVVNASPTCGRRVVDAIILATGQRCIANWREVSLEGQDVRVVQAKSSRLGMYLMGQALFSAELVKGFNPASVRSVALCKKDDSVLRPLMESFPDVEVVVQE